MNAFELHVGRGEQSPLEIAEARLIYQEDYVRNESILLRLRDAKERLLEDDLPEGFVYMQGTYIYPPGVDDYMFDILRNRGFDIRNFGPVLSGEEMYDHDLHDAVSTAVRPEEYKRIASILFRSHGSPPTFDPVKVPNPDYPNSAIHIFGHPTIDFSKVRPGESHHNPSVWHKLLDDMLRANNYYKHGNLFDREHYAFEGSGLAEHFDMLMSEGILPRVYMTAHLNNDLIYRRRDVVEKADDEDKRIYKLFKDNDFDPFSPEEIAGIASRLIDEVLDEYPEWAPDKR